MINSVRYDENDSFELGADDLTAYGVEAVVLLCRRNLVAKDWIEDGVVGRTEEFSLQLGWRLTLSGGVPTG